MKQTIHTILASFREDLASNRELGDRFERLICRHLELDPICGNRFSAVRLKNFQNSQKQLISNTLYSAA